MKPNMVPSLTLLVELPIDLSAVLSHLVTVSQSLSLSRNVTRFSPNLLCWISNILAKFLDYHNTLCLPYLLPSSFLHFSLCQHLLPPGELANSSILLAPSLQLRTKALENLICLLFHFLFFWLDTSWKRVHLKNYSHDQNTQNLVFWKPHEDTWNYLAEHAFTISNWILFKIINLGRRW